MLLSLKCPVLCVISDFILLGFPRSSITFPDMTNSKMHQLQPPKEFLLSTHPSGNFVRVPVNLRKLRQQVHECESVASEPFRVPAASSLADDRWQWKVLVYPNGQAHRLNELIVYVILVAVSPDDNAIADGSALLEQRLCVSVTMRACDDEGAPKYSWDSSSDRSDATKLFNWSKKSERWTRHSFKSGSFNRWRKAALEVRITEGRDYRLEGHRLGSYLYDRYGCDAEKAVVPVQTVAVEEDITGK